LEVIENEFPDVIGFQEITSSMLDFMRDALTEYMFFGCGRDKYIIKNNKENCDYSSQNLGRRIL
jgi:hypothetical protein